MPAVKLSPIFNGQIVDENGAPAVGWKINSYVAGSSTPLATYTTSAGNVPQSNPIIINTLGFVELGQLWLESGKSYKLVLTDAAGAIKKTEDNITGVNDTSTSVDEWGDSGLTPTYITASSFSLQGDQTSAYHIGRRLKFQVTAGTVYGRILTSVFASSITTVTMQMDGSQVLDSGLSIVQPSILRANVLSVPARIATTSGTDTYTATTGISRLVVGDEYRLRFSNASTTTAPTLNLDSTGALAIVLQDGSPPSAGALNGEHIVRYNGTNFTVLNPNYVLRGFIDGFNMSAPGGGTVLTINGGQAANSTNVTMLSRTAVYTKNLTAWAVGTGNGGKLSAAAILPSTWYAVYEIKRYDTGVEDVGFDISPTTPTLPAGYNAFRRIGAIWLNASSQIEGFVQDGDLFEWRTPAIEAFSVGTTAVLRTLARAPLGYPVIAQCSVFVNDTGGGINDAYHWDQALGSTQPGLPGAARIFVNTPVNQAFVANIAVRTNSSSQIYNMAGGVIPTYQLRVQSWLDQRGRNA